MFARQTPLPNNKNCRHGQATLEYLLAMGALLTSALVLEAVTEYAYTEEGTVAENFADCAEHEQGSREADTHKHAVKRGVADAVFGGKRLRAS